MMRSSKNVLRAGIVLVGLFPLLCRTGPCIGVARASDAPKPLKGIDPESAHFFETTIRPLLVEKCYECHTAEKRKGNLRLDSMATILKGGDSGPALIPGQPDQSLLVTAVGYQDPDLKMPPKSRLAPAQVEQLKKWVQMGAPWPGTAPQPPLASQADGAEKITDADRAYWAFQPIHCGDVPMVKRGDWVANPIDAFVLRKLEEKGLDPSAPADRRELIRRAYLDLIGIPPSPENVARFVADSSPGAYRKLVDQLLAMPQYGERWGKFWLDVVRFGETNGYERDGAKPYAWRFRDYVIGAFNRDEPYDQFVIDQLAGDELDRVTPDSLIASGYYRLGVWDDEPDDRRMAEFDDLDDIVRTTGTAFLGLTVNCARCHDHKFDPIPQSDYYALMSFFRNIRPYEPAKESPDSAVLRPLDDGPEFKKWEAAQLEKKQKIEAQMKALAPGDKAGMKSLKQELRKLSAEHGPSQWAMAARERGPQIPDMHVLVRGNASTPGPVVHPHFLSVLGGAAPQVPVRAADAQDNGLRLTLARWIARPENPLTARVMVNRIWQHHFGRGLVPTPDDFGKTGIAPTNPQLLDWLAAEFIRNGWSMKHMHKLIMTSNVYQMSSRSTDEKAIGMDPGNDLLWRQNMRRLEAEAIRDSILAVSGKLNLKPGGPSFFPALPARVLASQSRPGEGWGQSSEGDQCRRSIYIFVKRTLPVPLMDAFDAPNAALPAGERAVTTVAPQSLMLLNGDFVQEQATALAERLMREAPAEPSQRVERAFQLTLQRLPTPRERETAMNLLQQQKDLALASKPGREDADRIALRSFCLVLFNLNEFVYVD